MAYASLGQIAPSQIRQTTAVPVSPTKGIAMMAQAAPTCPAGQMPQTTARGDTVCVPVVTSFTPLIPALRFPQPAAPPPASITPESAAPAAKTGLGTGGILLLVLLGGGALYWYTTRKKK